MWEEKQQDLLRFQHDCKLLSRERGLGRTHRVGWGNQAVEARSLTQLRVQSICGGQKGSRADAQKETALKVCRRYLPEEVASSWGQTQSSLRATAVQQPGTQADAQTDMMEG